MSGLTLAVFLLAQAAPAVAPGSEVRAMTVTLLDEKGNEVTDVTASDVALVENGVARDVISFKPDRRPLSVAILVDSSAAVGSAYRLNVVDAVSGLVARLPEGARYAVWTTGDRPTKIQDLTDDRQAAGQVLRRVAPQGGNYVLDGVAEVAADLRKSAREGTRTVVVVVTFTGPEFSSLDRWRAAEDGAKGVALFVGVLVEGGEADFEQRTNVHYTLDKISSATGGRYETVLSAMGVDTALRKASALLRAGYRLSYATVPDLKKRRLELSVARPGTRALLPAETTRDAAPAAPEL